MRSGASNSRAGGVGAVWEEWADRNVLKRMSIQTLGVLIPTTHLSFCSALHLPVSAIQHTWHTLHCMGYGTASVALATTPTVIGAFFKHLLTHRAKRRDGLPEAEVSYDEGIQIVRSFLRFASKHTVEELQSFTKAKVPVPSWVIRAGVEIGQPHSDKAADILRTEFEDLDSTEAVG